MADEKIGSIRDAERAIEELKRKGAWATVAPDYNQAIDKALEILQRLKAGLRERIKELDEEDLDFTFKGCNCKQIAELRRVLSVSEVPEAERRGVGEEK